MNREQYSIALLLSFLVLWILLANDHFFSPTFVNFIYCISILVGVLFEVQHINLREKFLNYSFLIRGKSYEGSCILTAVCFLMFFTILSSPISHVTVQFAVTFFCLLRDVGNRDFITLSHCHMQRHKHSHDQLANLSTCRKIYGFV